VDQGGVTPLNERRRRLREAAAGAEGLHRGRYV